MNISLKYPPINIILLYFNKYFFIVRPYGQDSYFKLRTSSLDHDMKVTNDFIINQ